MDLEKYKTILDVWARYLSQLKAGGFLGNTSAECHWYAIGKIDGQDIFLTELELLCLFEFFRSFKLSVISEKLRLSLASVEFHLANIRQKLRCRDVLEILEHPAVVGLKSIF